MKHRPSTLGRDVRWAENILRSGGIILALQLSACTAPQDPASLLQQEVSQDPAAMMRIGAAAEGSQDWAGADTFYRRAAELDPAMASASLAHARMTARLGDMDAALADLRQAHLLHASDPGITTALGRMLASAKRPSEALTVFEDGLRADPDSAAMLVGKGVALDMLERHTDARQAYEAALKVDPDNAAAKRNMDLSRVLAERRQPRN